MLKRIKRRQDDNVIREIAAFSSKLRGHNLSLKSD